ncbi:MAG: SCO family protein [Proteobacteria bacterium]|nr:SCO family protein [Pseudomonadota bacterium]HQR03897.1 SCO family protein [Rhodocyclaceae bacterium]
MPHAITRLALVLVLLALAACSSKVTFNATDITGVDWGRDFHLRDSTGKPRQLADFRGKVVVVFFGYTHCPDVCPTTLSTLRTVMDALGTDAGKVQVLFVTLDPERDTPEILAQYVPAFYPSFLGLTGDPAQIAATAKEFKVFYQRQEGKAPGSYTLDHTASSFVFDPAGRLRLYVSPGQSAEKIVEDLRRLLNGA